MRDPSTPLNIQTWGERTALSIKNHNFENGSFAPCLIIRIKHPDMGRTHGPFKKKNHNFEDGSFANGSMRELGPERSRSEARGGKTKDKSHPTVESNACSGMKSRRGLCKKRASSPTTYLRCGSRVEMAWRMASPTWLLRGNGLNYLARREDWSNKKYGEGV